MCVLNLLLLLLFLPPVGAVRAVLRDGLHVPALQDLRRKRQRCEDRALQAPDVHLVSDGLAGEAARMLPSVIASQSFYLK